MIEQEVREIRGNTVRTLQSRQWFHELKQDIGTALRGLRRAPGFALVALATLALGIGGNVAVFSVVRSVLLRPLPYDRPEQLVQLWTDVRAAGGRAEPEWLSPAQFRDWRDNNTTFAGLTVWQGWGPNLTGSGDPELLTGAGVTWNFLDVLGVDVAMGRDFVQADDDAGAAPVVILTDGLWRRRFNADPAIVGQPIQLSGEPWTVVGVLPATFRAPFPWQIIRPMRRPTNSGCDRGCITLRGIGRLKPGVTLAQAQADLQTIQTRLGRDFPEDEANVKPWLVPLQEQLTGPVRKALVALLGAVGFVLLLACVNLAGLLVVRGGARAREFAVRASLGAGRRRIVRQLVTESLVLASIGGLVGFFAGWGGAKLLAALIPANLLLMVDIRPDLMVVLFTIGSRSWQGSSSGCCRRSRRAGPISWPCCAPRRVTAARRSAGAKRTRGGGARDRRDAARGRGTPHAKLPRPPAHRAGVPHQRHGDRGRLLSPDHLPACRGDSPAGR
jgi:predicted permease